MDGERNRTTAQWLGGIVLIVCLTFAGGQSTFTQDWPQEHTLGDIPLDPAVYEQYLKIWPERMLQALPDSYDARNYQMVTSPKNQGGCGSCWAFAAVGGMESHILRSYGGNPADLDLSEQQQVSCNTGMLGCSGGNASSLRYWENKGPLEESCFPYTGNDSTPCAEDQCIQLLYRLIDFHTVPTTINDFKNSLYTYGPSYWRFYVYSDFDTYWANGNPGDVYVSKSGAYLRGGHAVLLIGWDDGKGALLCKNSWGGGGPNNDGTFWIAYTGHYYNLAFGMSNFSLTSIGCSGDEECDDGFYCNGAETCVSGMCQEGEPVVCQNDLLFCNGSEVCDEGIDQCGHTGDPCGPGTVCNEGADQCDPVACYTDADCDDNEDCTTDFCTFPGTAEAYCDSAWPVCGPDDGCCGPACTYETDPDCTWCGNDLCEAGENCTTCPSDCISGTGGGTCDACFKGRCDGVCHPVKEGPDCADCAPSWCCGDGTCEGEEDGYNCAIDCGAPPECGDGTCDLGEDPCNCWQDCGTPPQFEAQCNDGIDNDCDGFTDCGDSDCSGDPACTCLTKGISCTTDDQCCSNKCRAGKCR